MNEITISDPSALIAHPAAALFPMLEERELAELAGDIRANGLVSPIVVKDGQILDGRNRLRACMGSITSWIFSVNLHRRHLTISQRAMLAARSIEVFATEARDRMEKGETVPEAEKGRSREKAADHAHVGHGTVHLAQTVLDKAVPELVAKVEAGDVPVKTAAQIAVLPAAEQREIVREKRETVRAKELRASRNVKPTVPAPRPAPPAPPPPAPTPAPQPAPPPEEPGADDGAEESTLDPRNRPDPQPIELTAFKSAYRKGTSPKDEAANVELILVAAGTALHAWRWLVIEWNEDRRWDMKFALHQSGQIAMHMNQAVAKLEEVAAICSGRKPAPPLEGP
jgi:hypothetical protein